MSQSFDFASNYTHTQLNGSDCSAIYLNGTRIWERYTAQRQVWVTSGYNQTSFQHIATLTAGNRSWNATSLDGYWHYSTRSDSAGYAVNAGNSAGLAAVPYYRKSNINAYRTTEFWVGTRRYSRGTYRSTPKTTRYHDLVIWDNVTSWVDTSGYQNEDYTAYYY